MKQVADKFECKYCHSSFERESNYLKHRCEKMRRDEEIKTTLGQAAYQFYSDWMVSYKRLVPAIDIFLTSRYYKSFIRFAKYVKDLNIPDTSVFIKMMREKDISPTIWTNDQVYALYLEYLDNKVKPVVHAKITVETLLRLSDDKKCSVEEIFANLHPNEVLQLIRERRLSPWILLFSKKFIEMLKNSTPEQQALFEALIRPHYWKRKFTNNPNYVSVMKRFVEELNI